MEAAANKFIQPIAGPAFDFASPPGEAALANPDSISWQLFKNPLTLFIGGVAAVILELAEPRVRTGVWERTTFREDPMRRLQRTGLAAMVTVYGPRSRTEAMIAGIGKKHERINGVTPGGMPYRADDPELLAWVHATAGFGILEAYHAYVRPLSVSERNRFYSEGLSSSSLYGAGSTPASEHELGLLFERMRGRLEPSPIIFEFLDITRRMPLLPAAFGPLQHWLVKAAVSLVPPWIRERLGLGSGWELQPWQRHLVTRTGQLVDRVLLRSSPAVQACRRLGLPDDYLYRVSHDA
jgi:uncharacterized protein (DUF2236 family)